MSFPLPPRRRLRASDFQIREMLGEGSIAMVYVAVEWTTGQRFALKVFDRRHLRSNHKEADVAMEEHCLRRANHPAIPKLYAAFRDDEMQYLVLELCAGGELWEYVRNAGCAENLARHYLAQLLEALSYLRDLQIVHRDVKAENVLIHQHGAAKLVDYGTCKDLANPHIKGAGTKSFRKVQEDHVGTPNFMAPEVIRNKSSDFRSDLWSFGCTVFQVHVGMAPFSGGSQYCVLKHALKAFLKFPPGVHPGTREFIMRLVVTDPSSRLGATDMRELRAHPYFSSLNVAVRMRFEGAHQRSAPVLSLEACCIRHIGRRWEQLRERAEAVAARDDLELRPEARMSIARIAQVVAVVGGRDRDQTSSEDSADEKRRARFGREDL